MLLWIRGSAEAPNIHVIVKVTAIEARFRVYAFKDDPSTFVSQVTIMNVVLNCSIAGKNGHNTVSVLFKYI